ncbi:MAG: tetratricopeptide repeat protein, partial [Acidimicrobiia bacterium]|nr:tetratricopeptide repeat protein [Acidimicrobiia bacterium]
PEPASPATDSGAPGELTIDPNTVSNEQLEEVIAQNPEINAMRLALADRYFDEESFSKALDHYLTVAENNPTPAEEGRALSRIGWMAYITGQPEAAEQYLRTSLTADPTNDETKLFLGFVLLYGLGDADGAIPWLEEVAAIPNLPPSLLAQVEAALDEARGEGG